MVPDKVSKSHVLQMFFLGQNTGKQACHSHSGSPAAALTTVTHPPSLTMAFCSAEFKSVAKGSFPGAPIKQREGKRYILYSPPTHLSLMVFLGSLILLLEPLFSFQTEFPSQSVKKT